MKKTNILSQSIFIFLAFLLVVFLIATCSNKPIDSIEIGVALPMNYDSYGVAPLNGIKLALQEIDYRLHGRKIELVVRSTEAIPKRGIDIINEFYSRGIQVVIGAAASNVSLAMVPIANRNKITMISPISSTSMLSKSGGNFFFRTVPADPAQSEIIVNWMMEARPKRVGILFVDNSWGRGLADSAQYHLSQKSVDIIRQKVISDEVTDFSTEITALKRANVEALFCPLYPKGAGLAVKQCFEIGLVVPIFGADSWGSQEFIDGAGNYAEGAMFCVPGIYSGDKYDTFVEKYREIYKEEPNFNAASSYDCMHIIANAIATVINDKEEITGENIRKHLAAMRYDGVTGLTRFDKNGDVAGKSYTKKIIRNGKFDFLFKG